MKSKVMFCFSPMMLALMMISGAGSAQAADVHFGVGIGDHGGYRHHEYRTTDSGYTTWYPDSTTTYVYDNGTPNTVYSDSSYSTYSTPYVYTTPSVGFNTWYGDGYHNHGGGSYHGGGYYGGGFHSGGSYHGGGRR